MLVVLCSPILCAHTTPVEEATVDIFAKNTVLTLFFSLSGKILGELSL